MNLDSQRRVGDSSAGLFPNAATSQPTRTPAPTGVPDWLIQELSDSKLVLRDALVPLRVAGNVPLAVVGSIPDSAPVSLAPEKPIVRMTMLAPRPCAVGETAIFQLMIQNCGNGDATGIRLRDTLPPGLKRVDGGQLNLDLGNLPPGQRLQVSLPTVATLGGPQTYRVQLTANGDMRHETEAIAQVSAPVLQLALDPPQAAVMNEPFNCRWSVVNRGTAPAHGIEFAVMAPENAFIVKANGPIEVVHAGRPFRFRLDALPPGMITGGDIVIRATVAGPCGIVLTAQSNNGAGTIARCPCNVADLTITPPRMFHRTDDSLPVESDPAAGNCETPRLADEPPAPVSLADFVRREAPAIRSMLQKFRDQPDQRELLIESHLRFSAIHKRASASENVALANACKSLARAVNLAIQGTLAADRRVIETLLHALTCIEKYSNNLVNGNADDGPLRGIATGFERVCDVAARSAKPAAVPPPAVAAVNDEVREVFAAEAEDHCRLLHTLLNGLDNEPAPKSRLRQIHRIAHTLKGTAGTVGLQPTSHLAHRVEELIGRLHERCEPVRLDHVQLLREAADAIEATATGKPLVENVASIHNRLDAFLQAMPPATRRLPPSRSLPATIVNAHRSKSRFTRVPVDRLDRLSQLLSDLQVAHTDLRRQAAGPDESHWARQTELIGEINDTLRRLRMLPLDALAQRLERTVRHISDYENKLVAFVMDGGPIEVDSRVLDQLADPLLHLLRNAVSHGIEDPMVRETQGKPRQGNAAIRARIEEQHLILDVTDDGAGIDTLAIREKGIEKGFLTPDAAERMSDDELLTLIFWPGFSTAARVSEVSGRGIGLDVVQTHIHQLNGTIQVVSELGRGTTFTIRVPL